MLHEANRRIAEHAERFRDDGMAAENEQIEFLCACGRADCMTTLALSKSEYERAHDSGGKRFVLIGGHQTYEIERVVEDHGDWVVVEKLPGRRG